MHCYRIILFSSLLMGFSHENYYYMVKYLTVPVDHFSFTNNATFELRYLVNDSYWNFNGPIFFYTGNEGDINMFAQNTGFMWDVAEEFGALIIFAEHRYYGESLPFGNLSYSSPKYLGYLTSTQALADYVYLIDYLQESNNYYQGDTKNPVIAFGGSYGGMLSAWLRIKYPAVVMGAISSSAPIWYFKDLIPCDIFNRIVTSVYRAASSYDCSKIISASWQAIRAVAATTAGKYWISTNWKTCTPLHTDQDIEILLDWLQDVYSNMAMVNYPYPTDFFVNLPAYPVKVFCDELQTTSLYPQQLVEKLGQALSVYVNTTGETACIDIFSSSPRLGETGWDFQSCTELVMPMCSKDSDMFISQDWNFTKFSEKCFNRWNISANTERTAILEYGGKDLQGASKIVFSNGLLDPWSGGGVLKNISKTVLAYIITDAAHHLDLRKSNVRDPPSVQAARNFHRNVIRDWLRSYYIDYFNVYYY